MASNSIEEAFRYKLVNTAGITTAIGAATKIFWLEAVPKTSFPYLTYFTVSDPHAPMSFDHTDSGQVRMQVNIFDDNKGRALSIAHTVRDALDQVSGAIDGVTFVAMNCEGIRVLKQMDDNAYQATFDTMIQYYDV